MKLVRYGDAWIRNTGPDRRRRSAAGPFAHSLGRDRRTFGDAVSTGYARSDPASLPTVFRIAPLGPCVGELGNSCALV